jgi:hypothetical protein
VRENDRRVLATAAADQSLEELTSLTASRIAAVMHRTRSVTIVAAIANRIQKPIEMQPP